MSKIIRYTEKERKEHLEIFQTRQKENPDYSLGQYAKDTGISTSTLYGWANKYNVPTRPEEPEEPKEPEEPMEEEPEKKDVPEQEEEEIEPVPVDEENPEPTEKEQEEVLIEDRVKDLEPKVTIEPTPEEVKEPEKKPFKIPPALLVGAGAILVFGVITLMIKARPAPQAQEQPQQKGGNPFGNLYTLDNL